MTLILIEWVSAYEPTGGHRCVASRGIEARRTASAT
jgi:hypothetical protein